MPPKAQRNEELRPERPTEELGFLERGQLALSHQQGRLGGLSALSQRGPRRSRCHSTIFVYFKVSMQLILKSLHQAARGFAPTPLKGEKLNKQQITKLNKGGWLGRLLKN